MATTAFAGLYGHHDRHHERKVVLSGPKTLSLC
jgi:hypothetical protein